MNEVEAVLPRVGEREPARAVASAPVRAR
jgi:hypothetical protein